MGSKFLVLLLLGFVIVWNTSAAEKLGTVTGSGPLKLRGQSVPASAAHGLVVLSGDEVETTDHEAAIMLQDSSRVTVDKDSLVKLVRRDGHTTVGVRQGGIRFYVAPGSNLRFCALSRLIVPSAPSEGTVVIEGADKVRAVTDKGTVVVDENKACGDSRKKAIVLVVAATAAGTVAGIATTGKRPPPTPPAPPQVVPPVSPR